MNNERFRCSAAALQTFELFAASSGAERERVAAWMSLRRHERRRFILRMGESARDVHFVVSGSVRACVYSKDGRQVQFEDLGAGSMFGELAAIDGAPRSADCFALEECVIATLSADRLRSLVHEMPHVADALLLRLASLARRHMQRVLEFSTAGVRQRVRLELLRMAATCTNVEPRGMVFDKVPTHADIASRVSTHREAVSRELKSLEASGIITWRPGSHVIHDIVRLSESADDV